MRLLQKVREIRSRKGELHFQRFAIFETSRVSLYIHRIHKADKDPHLHSHPWNFLTVVLSGSYVARGEEGDSVKSPGTWSAMNRHGFHKIQTILDGPVTTLFLAYGSRGPWYYDVDGKRIDNVFYREMRQSGEL